MLRRSNATTTSTSSWHPSKHGQSQSRYCSSRVYMTLTGIRLASELSGAIDLNVNVRLSLTNNCVDTHGAEKQSVTMTRGAVASPSTTDRPFAQLAGQADHSFGKQDGPDSGFNRYPKLAALGHNAQESLFPRELLK